MIWNQIICSAVIANNKWALRTEMEDLERAVIERGGDLGAGTTQGGTYGNDTGNRNAGVLVSALRRVCGVGCLMLALSACDDIEQTASGKLNPRAGYVYDMASDAYVKGGDEQVLNTPSYEQHWSTLVHPELTDEGVALIKSFEGLRLTPYRCSAGKWTVGWGHVIRPGEKFARITKAQAEALLRQDVQTAQAAVERYVTVHLADNEYSALVSFAYNVGGGNFRDSTLVRMLNAGHFKAAQRELAKWRYSGGKVNKGLVRRREAEETLFAGDM